MKPRICLAGFLTASFTALGIAGIASAQGFPSKSMRIVVPVAPGGGLDPQARLFGKKFQERMGQVVVIENRTGAAGMIGTEAVVKSPPDGYTLLCAASTLASMVTLNKKLPFDLTKDLLPVSQISSTPQFLVVLASVPADSLKSFVAMAQRQSGRMNAASGGTGSTNHMVLEMFKQRAGIQVTHIPYKGSGPATIALLSGDVDFSFAGAITAMPHVRNGKIRALAVTSAKTSVLVPTAPPLATFYPGFELSNWYAIFAPAATPATIVDKISSEIAAAIKTPDVREFLLKEGAEPVGSSPQEFATFFRLEVARYAEIIRAGNIRLE